VKSGKKILVLVGCILIVAILATMVACPSPAAPTTPPATGTTPPATGTAPATTPPPAGTIKLIAANWQPTQMPPPINWEPFDFSYNQFLDAIERETNGRVHFDRYPAETLVKAPDMWQAAESGVTDIADVNDSIYAGQFQMLNALRVPGLFASSSQAGIVKQMLFNEGYISSEWQGVKLLFIGCSLPTSIICRTKQIKTLDDFKGLKVAVLGEPDASVMKALGATPVGMSATEYYISLERGTVDAVWLDLVGQVAFKLYEVAPYSTVVPLSGGCSACGFVMNEDAYNNLPPDVKAVVDRNSGILWSTITGRYFDSTLGKCIDFLNAREDVPPIYTLPADEQAKFFAQAGDPVTAQAVADLEAKGLPATATFDRAHQLIDLVKSWGF
jgi:TRAP-type C4-dicarboxylate transport system substrate-binding protein